VEQREFACGAIHYIARRRGQFDLLLSIAELTLASLAFG